MNNIKPRPLRKERLTLKVSDEEKATIERMAYCAGMTTSAWIRYVLLKQTDDNTVNKEQE